MMKKMVALLLALMMISMAACAMAEALKQHSSYGSGSLSIIKDGETTLMMPSQGGVYYLNEGKYTMTAGTKEVPYRERVQLRISGNVELILAGVHIEYNGGDSRPPYESNAALDIDCNSSDSAMPSLTLTLKGENTITNMGSDLQASGFCAHMPTTIQSARDEANVEGKLSVSSKQTGIFVNNKLIIESGIIKINADDCGIALEGTQRVMTFCGGELDVELQEHGGLISADGLEYDAKKTVLMRQRVKDSVWSPVRNEYECQGMVLKTVEAVTLTYLRADGTVMKTQKTGKDYTTNLEYYDDEPPKGKIFDCWMTEEGTYINPFDSFTPREDMTLTPVFADGVTVTWITEGYTDSGRFQSGMVLEARSVANSAQGVFTGWKVSDVDMVLEPGTRFIADRDLTLIAQYDPQKMVKITVTEDEATYYAPAGKAYKLNFDFSNILIEWKASNGRTYGAAAWIPAEDMTKDLKLEPIYDPAVSAGKSINVKVVSDSKEYSKDLRVGNLMSMYSLLIDHWSSGKRVAKIIAPDESEYGQYDTIVIEQWMDKKTFKIVWENEPKPVVIPWPTIDMPDTGDASCLMGWLALLGASGAGAKAISRRKKAKHE